MSYDPMLTKSMGISDFLPEAEIVRGRINGLNPWPCISVPWQGERLKLLRAICTEAQGKAGSVLSADPKNCLVIACGKGAVRILEIQAPGGKRMKPEDYLRGHAIPVGTEFKEDEA